MLPLLQPGMMLGPYRIIGQIGQGGMATVYKAYHAAMDRYVAVKVLPPELARSDQFRGRFQQEARIIANLEHKHILPVYDFGESEGIYYFVMRYLESGSLKDRIQKEPLSLEEINKIFTQLAEALDYAHQRGVIHRDVKPANALLDTHGDLYLTDFGIAKMLESSTSFTTTGQLTGTPAYMSPEQAQGEKLDQRTDVYSLGIMLFEMVTGRVPFDAETPWAVVIKQINAPLPLPSSIKPDIHPEFERVLLKALTKDRNDRYASCGEFLQDWHGAYAAAKNPALPTLHTAPGPSAVAEKTLVQIKTLQVGDFFAKSKFWMGIGLVGLFAVVMLASLLFLQKPGATPAPAAPQATLPSAAVVVRVP